MRLVLLIPLLAAALRADPITVIQDRSPFGLTDLFYSYDVPAFPGPVTATIRGTASCPNAATTCDQPPTAAIALTMDLYTPGPARNGVALLQLLMSSDGTSAGTTNVSGALGPYSLSSCPKGLDCHLNGFFSFELGVPFTIDLRGLANGGAGFLSSASLQLFELPPPDSGFVGAPVQISLVPESGSAGLAFTGLSALLLFAVHRRRNLSRL